MVFVLVLFRGFFRSTGDGGVFGWAVFAEGKFLRSPAAILIIDGRSRTIQGN